MATILSLSARRCPCSGAHLRATGIDNDKGLGFFLDLGTMYQGEANVSFSENTAVSEDDMQSEKSTLEDFYTSQAQFYPVLHFGATYMF